MYTENYKKLRKIARRPKIAKYRSFNNYRMRNFHPMMSNSFQFSFWIVFKYIYSLNKPETINEIEKNSKGKLKRIWHHCVKITRRQIAGHFPCWEHTRRQVAGTYRFCQRDVSHEFKSSWIHATCCGNKILSPQQHFAWCIRRDLSLQAATCPRDLSPRVYLLYI